jgi:hypothetical protein
MRVLAELEVLRDQVRDEILKDPRYLTYQALQRSIDEIKAALDGAGASVLVTEPVVDHPRAPVSVNGSETPHVLPPAAQVDSEAMANLQHALIDLINRDRGVANGAGPARHDGDGSAGQADAAAVAIPPAQPPASGAAGSDPTD